MNKQATLRNVKEAGTPQRPDDAGKTLITYLRNGQALYWLSFFVLILVEFFLGGTLSKLLTKENYSLYVNILNTIPFYNVLVNVGMSYGIMYIVATNRNIRYPLFRQTITLQIGWYFLLVLVHALAYIVFGGVYLQCLLITAVVSFTYAYKLNLNSFFLAGKAYNKAAAANALQKISLLLIFLLIGASATSVQTLNAKYPVMYTAIELAITALYIMAFWATNAIAMRARKVNYRKRIFAFGKYSMFNNGLGLLYFTIMAFIIRGSGLDLHMQVIMGLCFMFFRYTGVAIAPMISIINPLLVAARNDRALAWKMYRRYFIYIVGMGILTTLLCRLLFGFIVTRFYASSYQDLPQYFYFFAYLIPLSFLNSLNASAMNAMGKIKYTFRTEVICTVLLMLFFIYNLVSPVGDYRIFYYMVSVHLVIKGILQMSGAYKLVRK